jgi:HPt (histidine-containing phosphotransfer) domain-containing protein
MPGTETPLTAEVFDQLRHAMAADRAGFTELYREYLADAWHTLEVLKETAPNRFEEIRQKAHYLKSSSLVLGARTVARLAGAVEDNARTSVSTDRDALDRIADALRQVQAELAERLGNGVIPADKSAA